MTTVSVSKALINNLIEIMECNDPNQSIINQLRALVAVPEGTKFGCYCDLEPQMEPDACVMDAHEYHNCSYAEEGKSREDCHYWKPITEENNIAAGIDRMAGLIATDAGQ